MFCGGDDVFCPTGSAAPVAVDVGYFSQGDLGQRSSQQICPLGKYCVQGVAADCPAGRYGDTPGLSSVDCSGQCADGVTTPASWRSPCSPDLR